MNTRAQQVRNDATQAKIDATFLPAPNHQQMDAAFLIYGPNNLGDFNDQANKYWRFRGVGLCGETRFGAYILQELLRINTIVCEDGPVGVQGWANIWPAFIVALRTGHIKNRPASYRDSDSEDKDSDRDSEPGQESDEEGDRGREDRDVEIKEEESANKLKEEDKDVNEQQILDLTFPSKPTNEQLTATWQTHGRGGINGGANNWHDFAGSGYRGRTQLGAFVLRSLLTTTAGMNYIPAIGMDYTQHKIQNHAYYPPFFRFKQMRIYHHIELRPGDEDDEISTQLEKVEEWFEYPLAEKGNLGDKRILEAEESDEDRGCSGRGGRGGRGGGSGGKPRGQPRGKRSKRLDGMGC